MKTSWEGYGAAPHSSRTHAPHEWPSRLPRPHWQCAASGRVPCGSAMVRAARQWAMVWSTPGRTGRVASSAWKTCASQADDGWVGNSSSRRLTSGRISSARPMSSSAAFTSASTRATLVSRVQAGVRVEVVAQADLRIADEAIGDFGKRELFREGEDVADRSSTLRPAWSEQLRIVHAQAQADDLFQRVAPPER